MRSILSLARVRAAATSRAVLVAAIALAIVGAQAVGLHHRVEHGTAHGWLFGSVAAPHAHDIGGEPHEHSASTGDREDGARPHDCAAIDALALGDAAPGADVASLGEPPPAAGRFPLLASSPAPTAPSPFRARAPPTFS